MMMQRKNWPVEVVAHRVLPIVFLKRVRDFALVEGKSSIDLEVAKKSLDRLKIDEAGLDKTDHDLLLAIIKKFNGDRLESNPLLHPLGKK